VVAKGEAKKTTLTGPRASYVPEGASPRKALVLSQNAEDATVGRGGTVGRKKTCGVGVGVGGLEWSREKHRVGGPWRTCPDLHVEVQVMRGRNQGKGGTNPVTVEKARQTYE